jgi:hypothetical protein
MNPGSANRLLCLCFLLALVSITAPAGAEPIHTVQGEEIPLKGTAPGLDVVYLFFTGPNLPDQGITLVGGTPVVTGDPASFTRAEVNTEGIWSYLWRTGEIGRILSPGTYTLYVVQEPLARPDLGGSVYAVQPVIFGGPLETATVTLPAITGALLVESSPSMSVVLLDNRTAGITPLQVSMIPPGPHAIAIIRNGYEDYRADITITAGERTEVYAALRPLPGSTLPTVTPTGATTAPMGIPLPILVPAGAVSLALLRFRRRT